MPKDKSNSSSRKKDKHSSRDKASRDCVKGSDAADEFSKRKHAGKYSTGDGKLSKKKAEVSGHVSGRKRPCVDHEDNCFASEYDDLEDGKKLIRNTTHVMQQHSRNGLVLPGISAKHSLVDYDDESSDSDSSSESLPPHYPTGKTPRRKSSVQVVSASVKSDLNDMRQQSHKSDATVLRQVRLSSGSSTKQSSSVNYDERNDSKKHKHSPAKSPAKSVKVPVDGKTKDIPMKSPKRRHSKDHQASRKCNDKEYEVPSEQINSRKSQVVDKSEKTSAVKDVSEEKDPKKARRRDIETDYLSTSVHSEKSKAHKKSKKHALSEEQSLENVDGVEHRSRTDVSKSSSSDTALFKKERSNKVSADSLDHCKTGDKADRQKKTSSHSDSVHETKHVPRDVSSVRPDDLVLKQSSDDRVHSHKRHEKEKRGTKKKLHAVEDSDSDNDKEKKDRSALKHDDRGTGSKSDKTKDKRNKDKLRHSRTEREFSDEGQISSDSSVDAAVKESKHKRHSHTTLKNRSSTPVRPSHSASASSKTAVTSEICQPER